MTAKEYLKSKGLNDHDYIDSGMIKHISEMMEEYHQTKQLPIHGVISRFFFDESEKMSMNVNEITIYIDPKYDDDKYVDIVISDDSWNELKTIKTINGL